MSSSTATLVGFTAILMWSLLSLLTVASGTVPPFQLAAMTFAISGGAGAATWLFRPGAAQALRQPPQVWALGVGGLFGYHALFFLALRLAPPAEAQLVNYLWPILIVLLSALAAGRTSAVASRRGRADRACRHRACCSPRAASRSRRIICRVSRPPSSRPSPGRSIRWLSRRFAAVPTDAVAGFCLATAALAAICHGLFEQTHWPQTLGQWLAVAGLGIGPVGAAFYAWDIGMKRGDIRVLGVGVVSCAAALDLLPGAGRLRHREHRTGPVGDPDRRRWRARRKGHDLATAVADGANRPRRRRGR